MRRLIISMVFVLASPSIFAATGQDILKKFDDLTNNFTDSTVTVEMFFIDSPTSQRKTTLELIQKVGEKRMVLFRSGILKGRGMLTLPGDKMFVYLPTYHKIRRVAAHVRSQSFMGSDMSLEDLSIGRFALKFDATIIKQDAKTVWLKLTPKASYRTDWKYLKFHIVKSTNLVSRIDYHDKNDKLRKSWFRKTYKKYGKCWAATDMIMTDFQRKHSTKMIVKSIKFDTGISDRTFTKKGLIRSL